MGDHHLAVGEWSTPDLGQGNPQGHHRRTVNVSAHSRNRDQPRNRSDETKYTARADPKAGTGVRQDQLQPERKRIYKVGVVATTAR